MKPRLTFRPRTQSVNSFFPRDLLPARLMSFRTFCVVIRRTRKPTLVLAKQSSPAGNYQPARADFLNASRLKPDDAAIRKRLELCEQIMSLDPTRRGLASNERYQRSLKLVALALDEINQCSRTSTPQELVDSANKALKARVTELRQNAAAEANLDLTEQLWQARGKDCGASGAVSDNALALVLAKIAQ